jgi:hypothetical protein
MLPVTACTIAAARRHDKKQAETMLVVPVTHGGKA